MRGPVACLLITATLTIAAGLAVGVWYEPVQAAGPTLTRTLTKDANFTPIQVAPTAQLFDGTLSTKTITNSVLTSNVVTITTSTAHGYVVGQRVTVTILTGPSAGDIVIMNGTYTITVVGSSTTFSYARTNANISTVASTGSTVMNWLSTIPTGTTSVTLTFPVGSFALVVVPTVGSLTDCTYTYASVNGVTVTDGGVFHLTSQTSNVIAGTEGDTVTIARGTTTPLDFLFCMGK